MLQRQLEAASDPFLRDRLMTLLSAYRCTVLPGTTTTVPPTTTTTTPTIGQPISMALCGVLRDRRAIAGPQERVFLDALLTEFRCQ